MIQQAVFQWIIFLFIYNWDQTFRRLNFVMPFKSIRSLVCSYKFKCFVLSCRLGDNFTQLDQSFTAGHPPGCICHPWRPSAYWGTSLGFCTDEDSAWWSPHAQPGKNKYGCQYTGKSMKNAPKLTLPALFTHTHTRLIKPKGKWSTSCPENSTSLNSSFLKCSPKNQATFAALQHQSDPTIPLHY